MSELLVIEGPRDRPLPGFRCVVGGPNDQWFSADDRERINREVLEARAAGASDEEVRNALRFPEPKSQGAFRFPVDFRDAPATQDLHDGSYAVYWEAWQSEEDKSPLDVGEDALVVTRDGRFEKAQLAPPQSLEDDKAKRRAIADALGIYLQDGQILVGEARLAAKSYATNKSLVPEYEAMGPVMGSIKRGSEWFRSLKAYVEEHLSLADQARWMSSVGLPDPPLGFDGPEDLVNCYGGIWNRLVQTDRLIREFTAWRD